MAISKHALFVAAIAAATGGPVLLSQNGQDDAADRRNPPRDVEFSAPRNPGPTGRGGELGDTPSAQLEPRRTVYSSAPLEGYPTGSLAEVFRFDVTPAYIMQHYGRVFTATPEADLRGYRVTLVTGTAEFDLAGSLTYYFDREQKVAIIRFIGSTGDPRQLVNLVTRKFGLEAEATTDPGRHLYRKKQGRSSPSVLEIRPGEVIYADDPHVRYALDLTLARPPETSTSRSAVSAPGVRRAWEPSF